MLKAWRFGAVETDAVTAVLAEGTRLLEWLPGLPRTAEADRRWPAVGSVVRSPDAGDVRGRHRQDGRSLAVVEAWDPMSQLVLRLRSTLGGWIRLTVVTRERPGGCLVEVHARPISAAARLRYAGPGQGKIEERCAVVAETLLRMAQEAGNQDTAGDGGPMHPP